VTVPEAATESFAGVANPWALGRLEPGERVLDLGSGAGTDSLIAAQMVGTAGHVTGIDMTPEMLAKARVAAAEMGASNVEFVEGRGGAAAVPQCELRRRRLERRSPTPFFQAWLDPRGPLMDASRCDLRHMRAGKSRGLSLLR
jgi:SAM-dependent methyltransferase